MLVNSSFESQKAVYFQKLNILLPDINDNIIKAFKIACNLQQEFVSKTLLHEKYPLTNDVFFDSYLLPLLKIFSVIPKKMLHPGLEFLDVGCGEGRMMLLLKEFGLNCSGIDKYCFSGLNLQGEPIGPLRKRFFEEKNVKVACLDVEKKPFPFSGSVFDLVMFEEVIEHFHNSPKMVLREIKRVIKPGGCVVVSTPNLVSLKKRMQLLKGNSIHWDLKRYYDYEFVAPPDLDYIGHTREFTLEEIVKMLKWAGFNNIIKAETYDNQPGFSAKDLISHCLRLRGRRISSELQHVCREIFPNLKENCLVVAQS